MRDGIGSERTGKAALAGAAAGLLAMALLAACGKKDESGAPDARNAPPAARAEPQAPRGGAAGAAEMSEAEAVAAASDWVKREGGSLILGLANGYSVTLEDDSAAGRAYVYKGFLKSLDEHYVRGTLDGGARHLLIDARTGSQKEAAGIPRLSPDGARAAAFRFPADSAQEAILQVWRKSCSSACSGCPDAPPCGPCPQLPGTCRTWSPGSGCASL